MKDKITFDNTINLTFLVIIVFFIFFQLSLPLWHDEIYQLWIISKDIDSIISISNADPNYPLQSIIYKLLFTLFGLENYENLVIVHFLSLLIVFFSLFLLRKALSYKKIIIFAFILFSSEYFLRFFFELRSYGFVFSWSVLFSSSYFLTIKLRDEDFYVYLLFVSGLVLSALHAISGLFVVSVMLKFLIENYSAPKRFFAIILIFISSLFVIIFSSGSVLANEDFHIDSYYNHIRNTGAFMIPVIFVGVSLFTSMSKRIFNKILFDISPIIFSMIIIFGYSILTSPFYQGRYFTAFFPFLALFLIYHLETKYFSILKIASILLVIFLYGPRASTPYTNFEGMMDSSHVNQCNGVPIFTENEAGFDSKIIFRSEFEERVFYTAEEFYSDIQRPVLSADETIKWWNENYKTNNCKVVGITTRDITMVKNTFSTKKNNISLSNSLADGCIENACGTIWHTD